MQQPTSSHGKALGAFIASHVRRELPEPVLDAARLCLADWLAVALGARDEGAGRIVRSSVDGWGGSGRSTVIYGGETSAPFAALANGTLAHCLDFDDTHMPSITHASAPVWAATLALGETTGATEAKTLSAFVVGFEVGTRVGRRLGQAVTARGFHSTGVWGRIGAAAAGVALLGLDDERAAHALATAATQASGFTASFGTMAKPFHAGKAAMDGVIAAELAARGFEANVQLLEPGGGLDGALIQDGSAQLGALDFSGWEILENSFKPYAACHLVHPACDAALLLATGPSVSAVHALVSPLCMQITGGAGGRPTTALAAKFDLRYCLALALHGRGLSARDFKEPWSIDPAVAATAARITAAASPALGVAAARLEARTPDRRTLASDVPIGKGHPGNPMTWDDMRQKVEGLVEPQLGRAITAEMLGLVRDFGTGAHALGRLRERLRAASNSRRQALA